MAKYICKKDRQLLFVLNNGSRVNSAAWKGRDLLENVLISIVSDV